MKKVAILAIAIGFLVSSCLPAPAATNPPTVDLDATAAVFVQQTLQALPTFTTAPTQTPVVVIETATSAPTETATVTSTVTTTGGSAVTSTGTLATARATTTGVTATATGTITSASATATLTPIPNGIPTETETLHPRFYGTLPPNVPYSSVELVNKSKAEAYISLQVTLADGSTSILEYPVGGLFAIQAPSGRYKYVAWVGGNKITGSFVLDNNKDIRITIYKDRVEVKTR